MKHTFFSGSILVLLSVFSGCTTDEKKETTAKPISFNPDLATDLFIEDLADNFHFVELEKHPVFLISRLSKLFVTDSLIVVTDLSQKTVFVFDKNGKPKSKVSRFGNGPGEYPQMVDTWFDKKANHIQVLDTKIPRIFTYSLQGDLIEEKKLARINQPTGKQFAKHKDVYVVDRMTLRGDNKRLGMYDQDMLFIGSYLTIPTSILNLGYSTQKIYHHTGDSLYYLPVLSDTIYSIHRDGPQARYYLDVPPKNKIPADFMNGEPLGGYTNFSGAIHSQWVHDASSISVTEDYVYFKYRYKSSQRGLFYSKKTGNIKQYKRLSSRSNPALMAYSSVIENHADFMVCSIHPTQYANLPDPRAKGWSEDTNAVLLFMKLKDF